MRSRSRIGSERTLTLENETLTLDRVLGKEKDEEGNLPGPPDTAVVRKVITAAMVGARTETRLGRGSGKTVSSPTLNLTQEGD